ncbi:MAG: glycosyltransferase family 2 protein [Candidatus Shapirobacteria bacterium]
MAKKLLISVVVNTLNEEKNISRCLSSVGNLASEIVVVDMYSDDKTRQVARSFGARVFLHERLNYVEPARSFAINKARGKWIFLLDADEKITSSLAKKLKQIAQGDRGEADYVLIPRKNIIFGKWIQNSRWWPDYLPRFFKKGKIDWPNQIHQQPELKGNILTLPDVEKFAIVHYNYDSLDQYLTRAVRYAQVQADQLVREKKYKLSSADLVLKPMGEFLSRFFVGGGYKDGLHGLGLAVLQSFSEALIYLKVWEKNRYEEKSLENRKIKEIFSQAVLEVDYWYSRWWTERAKGIRRTVLEIILKIKTSLLKLF